MDYTKLKKFLKPHPPYEESERITVQMALYGLLHKFAQSEVEKNEVAMLEKHYRDTLRAQYHAIYSPELYFNGLGPIGRRIVETMSIMDFVAKGQARELFEDVDLKAFLQTFRFEMVSSAETFHALNHFVGNITEQVFSRRFELVTPVIPVSESSAEDLIELKSSFVEREQFSIVIRLGEVIVKLVAFVETGFAHLLYWHPREEVWLLNRGEQQFPGMLAALAEEWATMEQSFRIPKITLSLPEAQADIEQKVNRIFDNEQLIPGVLRCLTKVSAFETRLVFQHSGYQWIFLNTRGQWPGRTQFLCHINTHAGATLDSLPGPLRQALLEAANRELDEVIKTYLDNSPIEAEAIPSTSAMIPVSYKAVQRTA